MFDRAKLREAGAMVERYNSAPGGINSGIRLGEDGFIIASADTNTQLVTETLISYDTQFNLPWILEQAVLMNLRKLAQLAGVPAGVTIH